SHSSFRLAGRRRKYSEQLTPNKSATPRASAVEEILSEQPPGDPTMSNRNLSRREFLGASAIGAVAGASMLATPARPAAEAIGGKPADLPNLTIKEVKMYVTNLGDIRR